MDLKYICSKVDWISHPPDKKWIDHSLNVERLSKKFLKDLPVKISELIPIKIWNILVSNISFFHDIGKGTKFFQDYIKSENKLKSELTNHSLLSALIVYWIIEKFLEKSIKDENERCILAFIAFMVVRYHHGDLQDPKTSTSIEDYQISLIKKQWDSINKEIFELILNFKEIPISIGEIDEKIKFLPDSFKVKRALIKFLINNKSLKYYFLTNILFSILIDSDKLSAGTNKIPNSEDILNDDLVDVFRNYKNWNNSKDSFDIIRNSSYYEAVNSLKNLNDEKIFSLQVPTGFGKTFSSLSVALKLMHMKKLKRIIYCLPFTSIIDQNYDEIYSMLETTLNRKIDSSIIIKHHHLSDIFYKSSDTEMSTLESQLLIESWYSKIIVTTFVQFFHTLIGYRNRALKKFHRLANCVIILDEVQTIPIKYWKVLKELLVFLSENFDTYIILVTATQPKILPDNKLFKLTDSRKYFKSINRTRLILRIDNGTDLEQLLKYVRNNSTSKNKIVVVLNTIKTAAEFFQMSKEHFKNAFYLSSYIIPKQRLKILKTINNIDKYFLVSTQVIEAGVNIDADIIYRDFAVLDSINQVAGRCNRFNKKAIGEVHIIKLKDKEFERLIASYIYDKSLLDITYKIFENRTECKEQEFIDLCEKYYERLSEFSFIESEKLLESIFKLKYTDDDYAISSFKLIEKNYEKFDVFIELDEEAKEVWAEYCELENIKDYWEKHSEYLKIKSKFQNYIISVNSTDLKSNPPPYVNGIFYVSKSQLEDYYDLETGFKKISSASIW